MVGPEKASAGTLENNLYLSSDCHYFFYLGSRLRVLRKTYGNGALSVVLPDVVVDCMLRTIPWTALTSSMCICWERALSSASVMDPVAKNKSAFGSSFRCQTASKVNQTSLLHPPQTSTSGQQLLYEAHWSLHWHGQAELYPAVHRPSHVLHRASKSAQQSL